MLDGRACADSKLDVITGITFSPNGDYAYVTDTGINRGFQGYNFSSPASM